MIKSDASCLIWNSLKSTLLQSDRYEVSDHNFLVQYELYLNVLHKTIITTNKLDLST